MDELHAHSEPPRDSRHPARVAFREKYLHLFVPVLANVHQHGAGLSMCERLEAVRFAADMSLVLTAGGVNWSQALARKLNRQSFQIDDGFSGTENSTKVDGPATRAPWPQSQRISMAEAIQMQTSASARQPMAKEPPRRRRYHRRSLQRSMRRSKSLGKAACTRAYIKALRPRLPRRPIEMRTPTHIVEEATADQIELKSLQNVIPGGNGLVDPCTLLREAADYILSLQMQVEALTTLTEASVQPARTS